MTAPNIILILVDQMRADCLGADGNPLIEITAVIGRVTAPFERLSSASLLITGTIRDLSRSFTSSNNNNNGNF